MEYYQKVLRPKSITTPPNYTFVTLYTARHWVPFGLIFLEKIPSINYTNIYFGLVPSEYSTTLSLLHVSHFSPIFPLPHSLHTGTAL